MLSHSDTTKSLYGPVAYVTKPIRSGRAGPAPPSRTRGACTGVEGAEMFFSGPCTHVHGGASPQHSGGSAGSVGHSGSGSLHPCSACPTIAAAQSTATSTSAASDRRGDRAAAYRHDRTAGKPTPRECCECATAASRGGSTKRCHRCVSVAIEPMRPSGDDMVEPRWCRQPPCCMPRTAARRAPAGRVSPTNRGPRSLHVRECGGRGSGGGFAQGVGAAEHADVLR